MYICSIHSSSMFISRHAAQAHPQERQSRPSLSQHTALKMTCSLEAARGEPELLLLDMVSGSAMEYWVSHGQQGRVAGSGKAQLEDTRPLEKWKDRMMHLQQ